MKSQNLFIILITTLFITSCNSSYLGTTSSYDFEPSTIDDYGSGNAGLNHQELANEFISKISQETGFNYNLLKTKTKKFNFIVALNPESNEIFAINIDTYNPNSSAENFLNNSAYLEGLESLPKGYYTEFTTEIVGYDRNNDPIYETVANEKYRISDEYIHTQSGLVFEKTNTKPKDLAKMAAITEVIELKEQGKLLSSNLGLSLNRANEVARLTRHWEEASMKAMTEKEVNAFSNEIFGFSLSLAIRATKSAMEGNGRQLDKLIEKAARQNNITPEHSVKLFNKLLK